MRNVKIIYTLVVLEFLSGLHSFMVPFKGEPHQKPYGPRLRALLSGDIAKYDENVPESQSLSWWQSLNRNNTIDCECGTFSQSTNADRWNEEGIYSLNVYPWSVSLVAPGGNYAFCGGTLVNDRYVLTSASCVDGSLSDGVEVLVGSWPAIHNPNTTDPDVLNSVSLFRKKVHRVILHPMYIDGYLDYNIALLRLLGPVPTFGNKGGVSNVCLPSTRAPPFSFDGLQATTLLWRFHETNGNFYPVKRTEVNSTILKIDECQSYNYSHIWHKIPDFIMCTEMERPTNENHPYSETWDCPGDAGGFLLVTEGHQKVQVGIDSWTACFGRPKGIALYTRLYQFMPWISLHISKDGRHCAH